MLVVPPLRWIKLISQTKTTERLISTKQHENSVLSLSQLACITLSTGFDVTLTSYHVTWRHCIASCNEHLLRLIIAVSFFRGFVQFSAASQLKWSTRSTVYIRIYAGLDVFCSEFFCFSAVFNFSHNYYSSTQVVSILTTYDLDGGHSIECKRTPAT